MKKFAFSLLACLIIISSAWADVDINSAFPDPSFNAYVRMFDIHGFDSDGNEKWDSKYSNGFLDGAELNVLANQMDIRINNVSSLKGIEYFPNIGYLEISYGGLSELNTSANPKLTSIWCEWLKLEKINLQSNNILTDLGLVNSEITEINLSSNTLIKNLTLDNNKLSELNLSSHHDLETLKCAENDLKVLDLRNNQKLRELKCDHNKLISLDLNSYNLDWIDCHNNKLEHLDLSTCTNLTSLKFLT